VNLPFHIARRYLFSKKSHNAINIISIISVCGIAVATLAMVCTLSIFNGFSQLVSDSFSMLDPDLQITPALGKVFDPAAKPIEEVKKLPEIEIASETIEDNAVALYGNKQEPVLVKGVSTVFEQMADIPHLMMNGSFILHDGDVDFCVAGIGLAMRLGLRADNITPMEFFVPIRDARINLANASASLSHEYAYPSGIFSLKQAKYDDQMVIVSIGLARKLFRYDTEVSALGIKLKKGADVSRVQKEIQKIAGNDFVVKNRFEQQADSFRMVNIEKWVTYLILIFILVIAVFNVVGSLSMLILDKSEDITILRNLGASNKLILRIFMIEGWFISFTGAVAGLVAGIALCLLQEHFGLLKLGQSPGAFIIDSYPVSVQISDIFFIFCTVCLIGFFIVLYPVNGLKKKLR
jgi:lipoprotein-releasing system permease protein